MGEEGPAGSSTGRNGSGFLVIGPCDGCDEALGVGLEDVKRDDGQGVIGAHLTYESMHPRRSVKCVYETKVFSTKMLMIECRNDEGATAALTPFAVCNAK